MAFLQPNAWWEITLHKTRGASHGGGSLLEWSQSPKTISQHQQWRTSTKTTITLCPGLRLLPGRKRVGQDASLNQSIKSTSDSNKHETIATQSNRALHLLTSKVDTSCTRQCLPCRKFAAFDETTNHEKPSATQRPKPKNLRQQTALLHTTCWLTS